MRFDTHLCLVSAQPTPNLTPVLDNRFSPARVVLVVSTGMEKQADWLTEVIRPHGVDVERLPITDAYDLHGCSDAMLNWLAENEGGNVALNVTGGTKLMALAAQEAFRTAGRHVFYVSAETDKVVFLDSALRNEGFVLSPKLRLRDYLGSHGFTLARPLAKPDIKAELRDLADHLISSVSRWAEALGMLNALATEAERRQRLTVRVSEPLAGSRSLEELLGEFAQAGMLISSKSEVHFVDENSRSFAKGGWLEFHVYRSVADLAPQLGITDYGMNAEVVAPNSVTRNEVDGIFLHRNRLHVIECKAGNLANASNAGDSKGTDALYKLESLGKLGGLRTREMLIDYRGKLADSDKARAAQSNIRVISAGQLRDLRGELQRWVCQ